jgi:hypothetical protein
MLQVPTATNVTLFPDTVQIAVFVLVYTIVSPALELAANVTGPAFNWTKAGAEATIVWLPCVTVNDRATCGAAANVPLPAWFASIVHVPTDTGVIVPPAVVVHTPVVALVNATASPELAVALAVTGPAVSAVVNGPLKVIV